MSDTTYWRVQRCPNRLFWRYRVKDYSRPGDGHIETFMTRRGAERFIARHTWVDTPIPPVRTEEP